MSINNSFLSYIDKQNKSLSSSFSNESLQLLEGEIECSHCDDCFFYFPFSENSFGRVFCTNFRLCFEPTVRSNNALLKRSRILDDFLHVPLCSIHSVYYSPVRQDQVQTITKKKFRRLLSSVSSLEMVSCIRIYLKDFRVVTIDLRDSQNAANLANQIFFFSRAASIDHIIQSGAKSDWLGKLAFNDVDSWTAELDRCGQSQQGKWRIFSQVTDGMRNFMHSYPMYFVVPADVMQYEIDRMMQYWRLGRFPVWVWSHFSGSSLLRSSKYDDNWEAPRLNARVLDCVAQNHPSNERPYCLELAADITPEKIALCFDRLLYLCSIDSYEQFVSREKDWLTRVCDTGWMRLVTYCLRVSAEVINLMVDRNRSVILCETDGLDVVAVVSSLVQVCCDRYFRSTTGLDSLISKEWIALGHPFAQRLLGVRCALEEKPTTPTFLLFLDCLAQLIRLYPMQFNYSHHLLIALWDVSLTGVVPAFSANSVADQLSVARNGGPFPLSRFYHAEYIALFSNVVNDAAQAVQKFNKFHSRSPTPLIYDVLRPPTLPIDVVFWSECYLRWVPPANIRHGGTLTQELALDEVMTSLAAKSIGIRWEKQFQQLKSMNNTISSAYPYSNAESVHCNGLSQLDSSDDTTSVTSISISSIRVKDKKSKHRSSIAVDSLSVISGTYPTDNCEARVQSNVSYNSQNTLRTNVQCGSTCPQKPREQQCPLPLSSSISSRRLYYNPSIECSTSKHISF